MSPVSTFWVTPFITAVLGPSKTWRTVEPTSRRVAVSHPARRRRNPARIVGITSPPAVGLMERTAAWPCSMVAG